MVAAEVKVADWLAQNELPLALKAPVAEDDGESVKSDVPIQQKSLKGAVRVQPSVFNVHYQPRQFRVFHENSHFYLRSELKI